MKSFLSPSPFDITAYFRAVISRRSDRVITPLPGKWGRPRSRKTSAFTLIETIIALAIVGVLLVSVFSLLGVAISENQWAVAQTGASNALSAIMADIRSVPVTATNSPIYNIVFPATGAPTSGNTTFYLNDDDQPVAATAARYQVNYWTTGSTPACQESIIRVVISWPANALYTNPQGSVETVILLNRVP
jgi:prepilin-type N-terminal cleavage/methylation domain-containing protein